MAFKKADAKELLEKINAGEMTAEAALAALGRTRTTIFELHPSSEKIGKALSRFGLEDGVYRIVSVEGEDGVNVLQVEFAPLEKDGKALVVSYKAPKAASASE